MVDSIASGTSLPSATQIVRGALVGSKQLKANAVKSSKVKNGSLLAGDFKAGQLPAGARGVQGLKGDKGDPCSSSDPNCKGPKGDTGPQGPGTLSLDGQFERDGDYHEITTVDGMPVVIACGATNSTVNLGIQRGDAARSFHAWGTSWDGSALGRALVTTDLDGQAQAVAVFGNTTAELDVVARSTAVGEPGRYTRFDLSGIRGNKCNYHALIIPPA